MKITHVILSLKCLRKKVASYFKPKKKNNYVKLNEGD